MTVTSVPSGFGWGERGRRLGRRILRMVLLVLVCACGSPAGPPLPSYSLDAAVSVADAGSGDAAEPRAPDAGDVCGERACGGYVAERVAPDAIDADATEGGTVVACGPGFVTLLRSVQGEWERTAIRASLDVTYRGCRVREDGSGATHVVFLRDQGSGFVQYTDLVYAHSGDEYEGVLLTSRGDAPALQLLGGRPRVALKTTDPSAPGSEQIAYAQPTATGWRLDPLPARRGVPEGPVYLLVGDAGLPQIVYARREPREVRRLRWTGQAWVDELLEVGWTPQWAGWSEGTLRLVVLTPTELALVAGVPGNWRLHRLAERGTNAAAAIDEDGALHVVYSSEDLAHRTLRGDELSEPMVHERGTSTRALVAAMEAGRLFWARVDAQGAQVWRN